MLKLLTTTILLSLILCFIQVEQVHSKKKSCKLTRGDGGKFMFNCDSPFDERTISRRNRTSKKIKRGPQGLPGPVGPPGKDGLAGLDGLEGTMGPIGPTGVPGPRGHRGKPGPRGERGDTGATGGQGLPGIPGNCLKDSPKYSKELNKHYHCLPGPQGKQGVRGRQGPPGLPGDSGEPGVQGLKGDEGQRGRRGPVGMPGLPGTIGTVSCDSHYTEWIGKYSQIEGNSIEGFFCPSGQFLQGFKREREGLKERYHFICCRIA